MRSPCSLIALPVVLLVLFAPVVSSQSWLDKVKKKVEQKTTQRADQKTDQAIDKGLDAAEDAIKCAATDQACIDNAQKSGKKVVLTDESGKPAPGRPAARPAHPPRPPRGSGARPRSGRWKGCGPTSTSCPGTA